MKRVVVIGGGSAGSGITAALRKAVQDGKVRLKVVERNKDLTHPNSKYCTWRKWHRALIDKFDLMQPLREALKKDAFGFGDKEKYPHFEHTFEGSERRRKIMGAFHCLSDNQIREWAETAMVRNQLDTFAFVSQNGEARWRCALDNMDPVTVHAILSVGMLDHFVFGTTVEGIDAKNKQVFTDNGAFRYDVLIDASGAKMLTSPNFVPIEWHNCSEFLLKVETPFPDWFLKRGVFRLDTDPNRDTEDPTNTSCACFYPVDFHHVVFTMDDFGGPGLLQAPGITGNMILDIHRKRMWKEIANDPQMEGHFGGAQIVEETFNTIPQSGYLRESLLGLIPYPRMLAQCENGIIRIGDAGLDATPLSAEGVRRGIESGLAAAVAIEESSDDAALKENYDRRRAEARVHDLTFHIARALVFWGQNYNDPVWDAQVENMKRMDDEALVKLLKNESRIIEVVGALPVTALIKRNVLRVLRGEKPKENY
ncbi:MAG: hypothetical protein ABII71_04760 [Candidatus Micrarchaeota archaeon]